MVDICGMVKYILIVELILTVQQQFIGCDSTAILNLVVNNSVSFTTITACDSYEWNGVTYTQSGGYVFNTINAKMDVTVQLIFSYSSTTVLHLKKM